MASGHVNRKKGRTHGCSDHCCTREENPCQPGAVHTWPIATGNALTANRRFRGIADMAGPVSLPAPVAIDTRKPAPDP